MADAIVHPWPIVSRKDAQAQGLDLYFTGKPCKHGHIDRRYISGACMTCQKKFARPSSERREQKAAYYLANKERILARKAEWKLKNADKVKETDRIYQQTHRPEAAARMAEWRAKNPDRDAANNHAYRERNREKLREYSNAWHKANKVVHAAAQRNRRARKRAAGGSHTSEQIAELAKKQRYKCASCRESIKRGYHGDHIMPLKLGGTNDILNIQLLCPTCNMKKRAKHPIEWAQENGRLL